MNNIVKNATINARLEFIQLGRTFHELSKHAGEADDIDIRYASNVGERLGWPDLFNEYRLIILSEAGSGKTVEIREAAKRLRAAGKKAFFLRLEHVTTDFEVAFEIGTEIEFRECMAGSEECWLLLDSVDESRLRNPRDFELAIRKIGFAIGAAKDHAHIVITGRTTAWRPKTDLDHCRTQLPYTPIIALPKSEPYGPEDSLQTESCKENSAAPDFKIVTLDDLNPEQIATFTAARGIKDTKAFLEAVERADARPFTARPQDLEYLTAFWVDKGRIGSRLEIMRNSIDRRLEERDQGRADACPMAIAHVREGARMLAAAATLSKDSTIRVPDGAANSQGIPVQVVLSNWNDIEQSTLLSRPIFDEAIYGTVRFHHRSVREYLTAEWFAQLLKFETSRRAIESLFFRAQYDTMIVTPTLRPILPWLCILDDKIRKRVLKIAPEIIFEGGDPSQLPLDDRRRILRDVCQQIADSTVGRSAQDYAAVQRFANEDLTTDVRELLRQYNSHDDLCTFLLHMVWIGQLKGALPEVLSIANSAAAQEYPRRMAFRTLRAIGSVEDRKIVRENFITQTLELNRRLLAELIGPEQPDNDTIVWLIAGLEKCEAKEQFSVDELSLETLKFVEHAPIDMLPILVEAFDELLAQPPVIERNYNEISEKFEWLLIPAALAVERLATLQHTATLTPICLSIIYKLARAKVYQSSELSKNESKLPEIVPGWPELNRVLFWFEVERVKAWSKKKDKQPQDFGCVSVYGSMCCFGKNDFDYVANQIILQAAPDNKLKALSLAFDIYRNYGRPRLWREKLKKITTENEALSNRLGSLICPSPQSEISRLNAGEKAWNRAWKKRHKAQQMKQAQDLAEWQAYLTENLDILKAQVRKNPGQFINPLRYLHYHCKGNPDSMRWTYDWQKLAPTFGDKVARLYRDAAVSFWRHYEPKIRSEGALFNEIPNEVIFGLVGLEIESHETFDWLDGLTSEEVERTCRFASFELNGFPAWFPQLFAAYPDVVSRFLLNEIRYELSIEKLETNINYILSDVALGQWAWDELAPKIHALLQENEPLNLSNLGKLLKIVQGSSLSAVTIETLASDKCRTLQDSLHVARWFAVWTGVDPDNAIPAFQTHIAAIVESKKAIDFAMVYVTHLLDGVRPGFQSVAHLKTLYLLMNQYICPDEDIVRANKGVYSPELRDHAQDGRNNLITMLLKIAGKDAYLALLEIASVTPASLWLTRLAKEKAEADGDIKAMTPSEVREIHDKHERTPTDHCQLADLALMRLHDLKDDLEDGDSSIASTLKKIQKEFEIRIYIGHVLRDKAAGRYKIPQEEELADAKKPDLRFHGVGFDNPVPVELKLADNWSGPDLFERLENQLCGDYLRDNRSNRGIYVLVYRGEKMRWELPDGSTVDFTELTTALQDHWKALSPSFPKIDHIDVIGIDLTRRSLSLARNLEQTVSNSADNQPEKVVEVS